MTFKLDLSHITPKAKPTIDIGIPPKRPSVSLGKIPVKPVDNNVEYENKPAYERGRNRVNMARARVRHEQREKLTIKVEPDVYNHEENHHWHWLIKDEQKPSEDHLLLAKLLQPMAFRKDGISHLTTKCEYQLTAIKRAEEVFKILSDFGWEIKRKQQ